MLSLNFTESDGSDLQGMLHGANRRFDQELLARSTFWEFRHSIRNAIPIPTNTNAQTEAGLTAKLPRPQPMQPASSKSTHGCCNGRSWYCLHDQSEAGTLVVQGELVKNFAESRNRPTTGTNFSASRLANVTTCDSQMQAGGACYSCDGQDIQRRRPRCLELGGRASSRSHPKESRFRCAVQRLCPPRHKR